jgi:hypothetical protein
VTEVTGETEEIATAGRDARAGEEDETATAKRLTEQKSQRKDAEAQGKNKNYLHGDTEKKANQPQKSRQIRPRSS